MAEIALFRPGELAPGEIRQVIPEGRDPIAVYNLDGEYFATSDICTHGEASLSEGDIEGGEVICPFHMGSFDIRTGEAMQAPCMEPIRSYPVRIEDDMLYVDIDG
jgi:nitrite reductase/ring-hydroxylating ferredoxin subunit